MRVERLDDSVAISLEPSAASAENRGIMLGVAEKSDK